MMPALDFRYWTFFTLGLLSLLLFMAGAMQWWRNRRQARHPHRLTDSSVAQTNPSIHPVQEGRWLSASPKLARWLSRWPGMAHYDLLLQQTGWPVSTAQSVFGSLAVAFLVLTLSALFYRNGLLSLLAALSSVLVIQAILVWRRHQRAAELEKQLPDALALIARSMQAGHAFSSALQIASQESPLPMGKELRGVFSEIQYGESVNEALSHWAARVAGQDVRIFVTAVRIQSESGGNLAELLHQTAALIRERQKLRGVVRVLSAEGRFSAVILTLLPFALASMLSALNPEFMGQLWTDPLGVRMLTVALGLMLIGVLWMWQLARTQP